ncbi:MAG TPA: PHB depolymerase family esterase [Polyangia bacterium]|nr:PHB depolymerase family esterase [Polyangia bacterium]
MKHPLSRHGAHEALANAFIGRVALCAAIACGVLAPALAQAASLSGPVSGWSSGVPSYVSMYEYIPAKLAASPPIVVAAHYCGGSASAFFGFSGMPGIEAAADQYGFVMIFPQTTNPASSADCWDVGSPKSLTHNGGGDTQAIAEMVQYEITKRNADPTRVYIMGASSGAMLTEAMLAVYPDVFKAGAEFSGVPAGCWSDGWSAASNWGGTCANGQDTMTAQAWGDLVRKMYPGYTGAYPRIQLWHGTADATINYNNETQGILEWTNLLGLSATPSSTDTTSTAGFTIEKWQNTCGFTVLEAHIQAGGGHTTPIDDTSVINFFGLNKSGADPQTAACGGSSGSGGSNGSGSGGSSGGAGTTGSAGTTGGGAGHGGTGGGTAGNGGHGGAVGGGTAGTTGGGGHAGTSGGGTAGTLGGGTAGASGGGTAGTFGGGIAGTSGGGTAGTTGSGVHAEGGTSGTGTGTGGQGEAGTSGVSAGGTTGNTGVGGASTGSGGSSGGDDSSGCSCGIASGPSGTGVLGGLALAAFGMALGRRPRRRR